MTDLEEIKEAVSRLSKDKLAEFSRCIRGFEASTWDREFEEDSAAGKLDALAAEALGDLSAGRCDAL